MLKEKLDGHTFISSHLAGKFFWNQFLLELNKGFLPGERVLRASEFWTQLLLAEDPTWKIIDPNVFPFLVEKWMMDFQNATGLPFLGKDRQVACQFLSQLLPLLTHETGHNAIERWFAENETANWQAWYGLSQYLWQHLKQKKLINEKLLPGLLVHRELNMSGEKFVFDLDLELSLIHI